MQNLSDFQQRELITASTGSELRLAVENLGAGITRQVTLELQPEVKTPEAKAIFAKSMELRMFFSNMAVTPPVYAFGIDDVHGGWVAWEHTSKANYLRGHITEKPATPRLVRQVLGQLLHSLSVLHERETPYVYRWITPDTIMARTDGSWALDGTLISAGESPWLSNGNDANSCTAPEVLDVDLGDISPATDLYSLGMAMYELALGRKLFQEQFPSVFAAAGNREPADLWTFWQISPQLTLKPLKELLPDFPEDLSDTVERMVRKAPADRKSAAAELLNKLNLAVGDKEIKNNLEGAKDEVILTPLAKALIAILAVIVLLGLGCLAIMDDEKVVTTVAVDNPSYITENDSVKISGTVENMPLDSMVYLAARNGQVVKRTQVPPNHKDGTFHAELLLPLTGEYIGVCGVLDSDNNPIARTSFTIVRNNPKEVVRHFELDPAIANADIILGFIHNNEERKEIILKTDENGIASASIPYGVYDINISLPGYAVYRQNYPLSADLKRKHHIDLVPVMGKLTDKKWGFEGVVDTNREFNEVMVAKEKLQNEIDALEAKKAAGTLTPEEAQKLAEMYKKMDVLNKKSSALMEKKEQAARDYYSRVRANILGTDASPAEKRAALASIQEGYTNFCNGMRNLSAEKREKGLQLAMDYQEKMQEIMNGPDSPEKKSAKLRELDENAEKQWLALQMTPEQQARLRQLENEYDKKRQEILDGPGTPEEKAAKLKALENELKMQKLALQMSPEQQARLQRLENEYAQKRQAILDGPGTPEEKAAKLKALEEEYAEKREKAVDDVLRRSLSREDAEDAFNRLHPEKKTSLELTPMDIASMPVTELSAHIATLLPVQAVHAKGNTATNMVDIYGFVMDEENKSLLLQRLAPAAARLNIALRIDPNALTRNLRQALEAENLPFSLVHPHIIGPQHRMLIMMEPDCDNAAIRMTARLANEFLVTSELFSINRLPQVQK